LISSEGKGAKATSDLYVGGYFNLAGSTPASNIVKWDGTSWIQLSDSSNNEGLNSAVTGLTNMNGKLYATGWFDGTSGGGITNLNRVAEWDPATSTWHALDTGLGTSDAFGSAIIAVGNKIYVAGHFDKAGSVSANSIAVWQESAPAAPAWSNLGDGIQIQSGGELAPGDVFALTSFGNEVYVGGDFNTAGGDVTNPIYNIAKWNGSSWSALGDAGGMIGYVFALDVEPSLNLLTNPPSTLKAKFNDKQK
jgi:trimeric autotransporter adhesin